jgi:hypothetical protein
MIQLPLTSDPSRTFTTVFGDTHYRLTTRWNERAQVWTLDIADGDTDEPLVGSMPIVLGSNILRSFRPDLGSMMVIDTAAAVDEGTDAGPDDLGSRIQLIWLALGEVVP